MQFRYLKREDLYDLEQFMNKIGKDFLPTRNKSQKGKLDKYLLNPKYKMILALDESKIIGYAAFIFKSNKRAALKGIGLLKKYRKKGIGKNLALLAIKEIKKKGIKTIISRTWESNTASQSLMGSIGLKKYRTIKNDRINGESSVWFKSQDQ